MVRITSSLCLSFPTEGRMEGYALYLARLWVRFTNTGCKPQGLCLTHKERVYGHTNILLITTCKHWWKSFVRTRMHLRSFFFISNVADLLILLIRSGADGELSSHHQGYLYIQIQQWCSARLSDQFMCQSTWKSCATLC